jgi:MFS family permease
MTTSNKYLVLYMVSLFITAIPFSAVGPLIPFMAAELSINETEYSVLFVMISASTFIAAIFYKILGKYRFLPKYHTVLIISCLEMVVFSVAFTFMSTKNTQCIIIAIIKFFNYIFVVSTNICLMMAPSKQYIERWMSFAHSTYGFGSLAGSILVGIL